MNNKLIPLDYANSLMFEMQKAFWDERGKGARFRMTTIGREYYQTKCRPLIKEAEIDHILHVIKDVLVNEGIVGTVSYNREDRMLRVSLGACVHRPIEERMVSFGVEPFTCMPANLIVLAIEEKLNRQVELAEIKLEEGACQLLMVVFEQRPALG